MPPKTTRYFLEIEAGPRPLNAERAETNILEDPNVIAVTWKGMTTVSSRQPRLEDEGTPQQQPAGDSPKPAPATSGRKRRAGPSATRPSLDPEPEPEIPAPDPDDLPFE